MEKLFRIGLFLTALSVALNAMGYHALKHRLEPIHLATFETASRYMMWMAIWIMLLAIARIHFYMSRMAFFSILIGGALFCGSLFLYLVWPFKPLVFVTPIGGILIIMGFLVASLKKKQ